MQIYNLNNIYQFSLIDNPVWTSKLLNATNKWEQYVVRKDVSFELSNGKVIHIPEGFRFDKSSTPRILWSFLPPDGDFIVAALIHDWLYKNKSVVTTEWFNANKKEAKKFSDYEMLLWSKAVNSTIKWSLKNIDNYTRYYGVRAFGFVAWNN